QMIRQQLGFDLRKDLIAGLGPRIAFYIQTPAGAARAENRSAQLITQFSGLTIAAQIRDRAAISRTLEPLINANNGFLEAQPQARHGADTPRRLDPLMNATTGFLEAQHQSGMARTPASAASAAPQFRKQAGARPTYVMEVPEGYLPPPFATMFRPTVILGTE